MAAGLDGDFQLGADAVGGADQDRILEPRRLQIEQRAEAAQAGGGTGPRGGPGEWLDGLDQRLAGIDVDTRVAIGQAIGDIGIADGFLAAVMVLW